MKNLLLSATVLSTIFISCNQTPQQNCPEPPPQVPKFLSQIILVGEQAHNSAKEYTGELQNNLINPVVKLALAGEKEVFTAFGAPWEKDLFFSMTKAEVAMKFLRADTMYIENPEPPYNLERIVQTDTSEMERIMALRAYESWNVDSLFKISKDVMAYTFITENINRKTGEVRGLEPKFTVQGTFDDKTKKKIATVRYTQQIDDFQSADVWYKFNLEPSVRERLFSGLIEATNGQRTTFYGEPNESSSLNSEEIRNMTRYVDTVYIESPEPDYELQLTVIEEEIYWDQISEIEFVQDVYVDANYNLHYDVKWYAPRVRDFDRATGEKKGLKTLFWVKSF